MTAVDKFPIPGVSVPGSQGDAAPGSVLARLRAEARVKRDSETLTLELRRPADLTRLRATYGVLSLDELERFTDANLSTSNLDQSLDLMARAVRSIEAYDPDAGRWFVLEDQLGPVTFDDRLTHLLGWERPPGTEFVFSVRQVYDELFGHNGMAIGSHVAAVAEFMGVVESEISSGEALTSARPTRSASPPSSGSTRVS